MFEKDLSKNMGVNIDKNEYYEIIKSNSNHPENLGKDYYNEAFGKPSKSRVEEL